jgi:hypothetical protein
MPTTYTGDLGHLSTIYDQLCFLFALLHWVYILLSNSIEFLGYNHSCVNVAKLWLALASLVP